MPGENRCDFVLPRGVPVSGIVLLPDGRPARGTQLYVGFSRYAFDRLDAIARDLGEFTFPSVPAGKHRLVAERRGCAALEQTVDVPEGSTSVEGLVLRLTP